jgi:hypothetical protein
VPSCEGSKPAPATIGSDFDGDVRDSRQSLSRRWYLPNEISERLRMAFSLRHAECLPIDDADICAG